MFSPIPALISYIHSKTKLKQKRRLMLLLIIALTPMYAFWLFKLGLYLVLPALYISVIYSSFVKRENRVPGISDQLRDIETSLNRPIRLLLKPIHVLINLTENLLEEIPSTIFLSLALGFVAPLATISYLRGRQRSLLRDFAFLGSLVIGYAWGILWLIRIGWLLSFLFLPFAASFSSYKRCTPQISMEKALPMLIKPPFPYAGAVHVLILVHSLLLSYLWLRDPSIVNPDNAYHVLISKMLAEKGFFMWDYVEFAPLGRPHLYPPLFHALVAILGKVLGGSPWAFVFANDLISVGIYSLGLYASWYVGRKLYHEIGGFIVFTITSGLLMPALSMAIGLPSTLVFIFTPLAALWFLEGKLLPSFIACTASFYSHTSGVVITPITFMLTGILAKKFRQALKLLSLSLLVYSPWLLRILIFLEWFKLPEADIPTKIEPALIVPAIVGLIIALRYPRKYALQLGYLASLIPVIASYPGRASIQGCFALALLATLFFKRVFQRIPKEHLRKALTTFFLFFYVFPLGPSAIMLESFMLFEENPLGGEISWNIAEQLGSLLRQNVEENEIVHFQQPYLGCAVAVFAPIRIDGGAWGEVAPEDTGGRIGENINVLVIKQLAPMQEDMGPTFQFLGSIDRFLVIKLDQEAIDTFMLRDLMNRIYVHANETYNFITINKTKAAIHLSSLELLFTALSLFYKEKNPALSKKVQELAQFSGMLSTILTEEWAKNLLTDEQIREIRNYLQIIIDLAKLGDFSPLLEEG